MNIFNLIYMLGGLAIFLYGMELMGKGLAKLAGGKLETLLEKLTSTTFTGIIVGAFVTAIIHSSAATTVMVVGFVNSGIMKLSQAIGVIMGANIGTTITAWILSLSGISSNNIFLNMLEPKNFAPFFAFVSVIMILFIKNQKINDIGNIIFGFSILMIGMETMTEAIKPLADVPEFQEVLIKFNNPIIGILLGAIVTAILQSSTVSVGILQALCLTGSITYIVALPIIMGQNIGTCITAILSSFGASKNAKRAAAVHLLFNMFGTVIFLVLFYAIHFVRPFEFVNDVVNPANIATIHTVFNVSCTIMLFPFAKILEKVTLLLIKDDENDVVLDDDFRLLDNRFLDMPSFAIEQAKTISFHMAELAKLSVDRTIDMYYNYKSNDFEEIEIIEQKVDIYYDKLNTYLLNINSNDLNDKDNKKLNIIINTINDFERIADHSINIAEFLDKYHKKNIKFTKEADEELSIFLNALKELMELTINVFEKEDSILARNIEPLEEVIDLLNYEMKKRHLKRLRNSECSAELGIVFSDLLTNYERIADHCSNIGISIIEIIESEYFVMHRYIDEIRMKDDAEFKVKYKTIREKYKLPKRENLKK